MGLMLIRGVAGEQDQSPRTDQIIEPIQPISKAVETLQEVSLAATAISDANNFLCLA
jgi:hypothetical protein